MSLPKSEKDSNKYLIQTRGVSMKALYLAQFGKNY